MISSCSDHNLMNHTSAILPLRGDFFSVEFEVSFSSVQQQKYHAYSLISKQIHKEVIILRKTCHERDRSLKDKDDAIELLAKKVDTLTKAMEVEAKKMKREVAAMEKEVTAMLVDKEQDNRGKRLGSSRGPVSISKLLSGRNVPGTAVRQKLQ